MGFLSFFENPLGTLESWGDDIVSKGRGFVSDIASGNIGGALGNLAGLATNLTPIGAAMNAFTGGSLQDGVFKTIDGITHGDKDEALGGLLEGIFASSPALNLVNDILGGKPLVWADHLLGVDPATNTTTKVEWPKAAPATASPSDDTLASCERVGRALTAITNQHNNGGPVIRLPNHASKFQLLISHKDNSQFLNQPDCQWYAAFDPPPRSKPVWSIDDTLQTASMLAFAIPEVGAVVSGGITALELFRKNLENQDPKVDPLIEYLGRSFSALQQFIDKELKDQQIQQAVAFFRGKQDAVLQPFAAALKNQAVLSKDILSDCADMLDKGEDALSTLMYDYRAVGNLAVAPTVSEYAFRTWIDAANTFLFCMKVGCILSAVKDEDWSDLSGALKRVPLTRRIAESQDAYRYFQKVNGVLGTSTSTFRRHLQLTLISMHQKLARRLDMISPGIGDNNLVQYQPGWQVGVDYGITTDRATGTSDAAVDDFIVAHINWPRVATEKTDHLVRGASDDDPPKAIWQRAGGYTVGTPDTVTKNTYAYMVLVANHYVDAFNYDVGTDDAPTSLLQVAISVAEKWWADDNSLWQTLTRSLALYQLHAARDGSVQSFWDALKVPKKEDVKALLAAYVNSVQSSRSAGATGLNNAGKTAQSSAKDIAGTYSWGG